VAGRQKPAFPAVYCGLLGDFRTSLGVAGSLWKWDGWPLRLNAKPLFSLNNELAFCADAPCPYPKKIWLQEDVIGHRKDSALLTKLSV
jgi:hypothetical protein